MAHYTIIPSDQKINKAGNCIRGCAFDGAKVFHAVQYDSETKKGHLEFFDDTPNIKINSEADVLTHTGISFSEWDKRFQDRFEKIDDQGLENQIGDVIKNSRPIPIET